MYPKEASVKEYVDEPQHSSKLPLSHQEKSLVELHEAIGFLTERLKPVLTPTSETDGTKLAEGKDLPVQSPLAEQISANNSGIYKATNKLRGLMERLEI